MKKLNFLWMLGLLMFAAVNFSSCSKDEDEVNSSELVGLWEMIRSEGWEKYNGEIQDEWHEEDISYRVRFNADGTYETYDNYDGDWDLDDEGTWEYKNGQLYITEHDYDEEEEYVEVATIKELSSTSLVLEAFNEEDNYEFYNLTTYKKIN